MTGIVFVVVLVAAWAHYETVGAVTAAGYTVYVLAFVATLASASTAALVSRSVRSVAAACVLVANFAGSHFAWQQADPLLWQAALDVATAAYFAVVFRTRWELAVGTIYAASVVAAVAAHFGIVDDHTTRQSTFIALSYPDVAALLGHAASVVVGAGAGDAGRRAGAALEVWPLAPDNRMRTRPLLGALAALAPWRRQEGSDRTLTD